MLGSALARRNFALLTTYRRNGQPVATTIWFALDGDNTAYFMTGPQTGKAKRIRNNPRVQIAASNPRGNPAGPVVDGRARRLGGAEAANAQRLLARKYGIQWTVFGIVARIRGFGEPAFYELTEVP